MSKIKKQEDCTEADELQFMWTSANRNENSRQNKREPVEKRPGRGGERVRHNPIKKKVNNIIITRVTNTCEKIQKRNEKNSIDQTQNINRLFLSRVFLCDRWRRRGDGSGFTSPDSATIWPLTSECFTGGRWKHSEDQRRVRLLLFGVWWRKMILKCV